MAKNSQDRGQTMPFTFIRRWSRFLVIRVLLRFRSQRRLYLGVSFKSGFIRKSGVHVRILQEFGYLLSKSFPLSFILTLRPRLRRFQGESARGRFLAIRPSRPPSLKSFTQFREIGEHFAHFSSSPYETNNAYPPITSGASRLPRLPMRQEMASTRHEKALVFNVLLGVCCFA